MATKQEEIENLLKRLPETFQIKVISKETGNYVEYNKLRVISEYVTDFPSQTNGGITTKKIVTFLEVSE